MALRSFISKSLPSRQRLHAAYCRTGASATTDFRNRRLYATASSASESAAEGAEAATSSGTSSVPKIVVFGGRGFVGSAVCKEALAMGLSVVSISPSGTPPLVHESWASKVEWVRGNALEPATFRHHLLGAMAAISCIGGFGSNETMMKVNGTANVSVIGESKVAGVPRFVFISAHIPPVPGIDTLLKGYVQGKAETEAALKTAYPTGGVALRPGVIYGPRIVSENLTIPLQVVGAPMEALLARLPFSTRQAASTPFLGALLVPPVPVTAVAKAAVTAATDPSVPSGIMDVWKIQEYK